MPDIISNISTNFKDAFKELQKNKYKTNLSKIVIPKSRTNYHIHFGAGKLGIGLVIPKFDKRKIIIIQRLSKDWLTLKSYKTVKLSINDVAFREISLIHEFTSNFHTLLSNKLNNGESFIICTNKQIIIKELLKNSSSISTALGQKGFQELKPLLEEFKTQKHTINLYPFENDYSGINSFRNKKINIINITADKICNERVINKNVLSVKAEDYEEIIIHNRRKLRNELMGRNIIYLENECEYNFYHKRKLYLVNGIHIIAALFGYEYLIRRKVPPEQWKSLTLTIIMGMEYIRKILILFTSIQALRLISETDIQTLKNLFPAQNINNIYKELIDFGQSTIEKRFNFSLDPLDRILRIDQDNFDNLKNKINERVYKITEFVKSPELNKVISEMNLIEFKEIDFYKAGIELGEVITKLLMEIMKNSHKTLKVQFKDSSFFDSL